MLWTIWKWYHVWLLLLLLQPNQLFMIVETSTLQFTRTTINYQCLQPPLHYYQESPGLWAFTDKQTAHLTWHQKQQLPSAGPWTAVFLQQWRYAALRVSKLRSATFYEGPGSTSPRTRDSRASTLHELGGACWCCWKGGTSTHESELCSFVSDVDVDMRSHFQPLSAKCQKKLSYWLTHLFSEYLV